MPSSDSSVPYSVVDVGEASTLERCVLLVSGVTLASAVLCGSFAVYGLVTEGAAGLWFWGSGVAALTVLYGLQKVSTRLIFFPPVFIAGVGLTVLYYGAIPLLGTTLNSTQSADLWIIFVILLLIMIRSLKAMNDGAFGIFSVVGVYRRRWAKNGSYMRFVLTRGLAHPKSLLCYGVALALILVIPPGRQFVQSGNVGYGPQVGAVTLACIISAWAAL
jgi:hypothetical protein